MFNYCSANTEISVCTSLLEQRNQTFQFSMTVWKFITLFDNTWYWPCRNTIKDCVKIILNITVIYSILEFSVPPNEILVALCKTKLQNKTLVKISVAGVLYLITDLFPKRHRKTLTDKNVFNYLYSNNYLLQRRFFYWELCIIWLSFFSCVLSRSR